MANRAIDLKRRANRNPAGPPRSGESQSISSCAAGLSVLQINDPEKIDSKRTIRKTKRKVENEISDFRENSVKSRDGKGRVFELKMGIQAGGYSCANN